MIIYSKTVREFQEDCFEGVLIDTLDRTIRNCYHGSSGGEIRAWKNSLSYVDRIIQHANLPKNSGVAIEYMIPTTSKRIDFLVSGYDEKGKATVVIMELKQWDKAEVVLDKEDIVKTYVGGANREVAHPSYQAWSYAELIRNFNESAQDGKIDLYPCAYLHNYIYQKEDEPLLNKKYQAILDKSPLFSSRENQKLVNFLNGHIKQGDARSVLFEIENGKIRPSKSLQDQLASLLDGNPEFTLIDDQKLVYEKALALAEKTRRDGKKRIYIVEGGPGTGKSVVSVNLLVEMIRRGLVATYVTKNSTPRAVYSAKLAGTRKKTVINNLFKSSGAFHRMDADSCDALIVDEAHRLSKKINMYNNDCTQARDLMRVAKFAVFFVDDHQVISMEDIGSKATILQEAHLKNAIIECDELKSQFRCNGSDGYLAWIDDVLQIRHTANPFFDVDYDFDIVDTPNELLNWVLSKNKDNKARIIAGYCWDWPKDSRDQEAIPDIVLPEYHFSMSWNLRTGIWAIDPNSVKEAGCIHTSQGLEFDYVGIIIGPDMYYEDGTVKTDFMKRAKTDKSINGLKGLNKVNPRAAHEKGEEIIKNTYRTLLTRGMKGCRVFCTDRALSDYLKKRYKNNTRDIYDQVNSGEDLAAQEPSSYQ